VAGTVDEDELIEHWTLVGAELELLAGKRGPTRLAFVLLLKFHQQHGRFPRGRTDLPGEAVEFAAKAVKVPAVDLAFYDWEGRTFEYHRAQIRTFTGFRECTLADADKATEWLATNVCQSERRSDRVRVALLAHLKDELIEPPAKTRLLRVIGSALQQAQDTLTLRISSRVAAEAIEAMFALIDRPGSEGDNDGVDEDGGLVGVEEDQDEEGPGEDVFAAIREEPGNVSVKTIEREVFKLGAIEAVGLPGSCSTTSPRGCWRPGGRGSRLRRPVICVSTHTRSR
jgi:Domain of unknown function (DUF4158)